MAGERCSKRFWREVKNPSGETGVVCRSGGKRRSHYGGVEKMSVNRDRTVVENDGDVRRYVWTTPIATYDRDKNKLILKDGGFQTRLTKERLNQILSKLGKRIKQRDYEWYINDEKWTGREEEKLDSTI